MFDKLLVNFTWWVNLEDAGGRNVYEGGFPGPDNIGPLDRSRLPVGGVLEQSDATGWMGFYAIALSGIATALSRTGQRPMSDLLVKFMEHFAAIRDALDSQGLWDSDDGFYYDRLVTPSGEQVPIRVPSMVGMIPLLAAAVVSEDDLQQALVFGKQFADLLGREGLVDAGVLRERGVLRELGGQERLLLSLAGPDRLARHRTAPARGTAPRKPAGPRDLRQPPGAKTGRPHRTTAGDQATQDRPGPPTGQDYVLLVHGNGA